MRRRWLPWEAEEQRRLVPSFGLWRTVLRRMAADWPLVLAAWLLLLCATSVLAAGALYAEGVAVAGLRQALAGGAPAERNALAWTTLRVGDVAAYDAVVSAGLQHVVAGTGGEIGRVARDSWIAASGPDSGGAAISGLVGHERLDAHATLVAGRWPVAGRAEASLPAGLAGVLALGPGDRLDLADPRDPGHALALTVAGVWQPLPDDPYWQAIGGDEFAEASGERAPVVVPLADLLAAPAGRRIGFEWRLLPDLARLDLEAAEPFRTRLEALSIRLESALPAATFTVRSSLPARIAEAGRTALVSRAGVIALVVQFAALAAYAVLLVAGILLERRRQAIALLEARGAGRSQVVAMAFAEAVVLAAPAVVLAPVVGWLAVVGLDAVAGGGAGTDGSSPLAGAPVAAAAVGAAACLLALTLPALAPTLLPARIRQAAARQGGRTLAQRLGLDLVLVALAGVALWQLRLYGAPLTADARGTLGIDPLLVAAPAIGLVAGGILAIRLLPALAEAAERAFGRRRGLLSLLAASQVSRRPLRYTRSALLLVLAAALGTFAAVYGATWSRSQADQAAFQAAADLRVIEPAHPRLPSWGRGAALRAIPGVERAVPVARASLDVGRAVRDARLLAVDPGALAGLLSIEPVGADPAWPAVADALAAARPHAGTELPGGAVALVVTTDVALGVEAGPGAASPSVAYGTLQVTVLLVDGDGRVHRLSSAPKPSATARSGHEVALGGDVDGHALEVAPPVRLLGVELGITTPPGATVFGSVDLLAVEARAATGAATPVVVAGGAGWTWSWTRGRDTAPYAPPPDAPGRVTIGGAGGIPAEEGETSPLVVRAAATPSLPEAIPVVAGGRFAELAGAGVGDRLNASVAGRSIPIVVAGTVTALPPMPPTASFVVADLTTLGLERFAATAETTDAAEWWLAVEPGRAEGVLEAVRAAPFGALESVEPGALARSLVSDPLALGVIGALLLGAVAAAAFGAIGFIVNATVATAERADEFAILRALGLSSRELGWWLALENAFLLGLGLAAGGLIGLLLGWTVLPFATLTRTGAPPVPEPAIVVPWAQLLPIAAVAAVLLAAAVGVVRRRVATLQLTDVLRGLED